MKFIFSSFLLLFFFAHPTLVLPQPPPPSPSLRRYLVFKSSYRWSPAFYRFRIFVSTWCHPQFSTLINIETINFFSVSALRTAALLSRWIDNAIPGIVPRKWFLTIRRRSKRPASKVSGLLFAAPGTGVEKDRNFSTALELCQVAKLLHVKRTRSCNVDQKEAFRVALRGNTGVRRFYCQITRVA